MTDIAQRGFEPITPRQFHQADGVQDWRFVAGGACTYFRTGSFGIGARLAQSISALPGLDDHQPDVDLRPAGVTVRLLTLAPDYCGVSRGLRCDVRLDRVRAELTQHDRSIATAAQRPARNHRSRPTGPHRRLTCQKSLVFPTYFELVVAVSGAVLTSLLAAAYLRRVRLERPAIGTFNDRDVASLFGFIVVLPVLYVAVPQWCSRHPLRSSAPVGVPEPASA